MQGAVSEAGATHTDARDRARLWVLALALALDIARRAPGDGLAAAAMLKARGDCRAGEVAVGARRCDAFPTGRFRLNAVVQVGGPP